VKYQVIPTKRAEKELERLDRATLRRLQARIDELSQAPLSPRLSKPLEMGAGERSARVGDWRIIYQVDPARPYTMESRFS
jgi:mRNA-degrading endonuclease RelE of RelBE toxin-antitoxin system